MRVIDYKLSMELLLEFKKNWNAKNEIPGLKIKEEHLETMRAILRLYAKRLNVMKFLQPGDKLPALFTTNKQLSGFRGRTGRTIQRHRIILSKAGFLTGYKFHGSTHPFEIEINPQLIFIGKKLDAAELDSIISSYENPIFAPDQNNQVAQVTQDPPPVQLAQDHQGTQLPLAPYKTGRSCNPLQIGSIIFSIRTRCLHTDSAPTHDPSLDHLKISKDVKKKADSPVINTQANTPGESFYQKGRNTEIMRPASEIEKKEKRTGPGANDTEVMRRVGEYFSPPFLALIQNYINELWQTCSSLLYDEIILSNNQIMIGRESFQTFLLHKCTTENEIEQRRKMLMKMILLASHYKNKKLAPGQPPRFIPLPSKYFDKNFEKGFVRGAYKWFLHDRELEKQRECETLLKQCIRAFFKNEDLPISNRKKISSIQMFQQCRFKLLKLKRPDFLDLFANAVANPKDFKNINLRPINYENKQHDRKTPVGN